jgi:isopentenyldiphosphate isomerase
MQPAQQTNDLYDVLDEEGMSTGKVLDRVAVHDKELWHDVVNVWVVNTKGEILLQLRAPDVELCPGVWDVAMGTHIRHGETHTDAALRGLKTELGLAVTPEELKHMFNIKCANPMANGTTHKVVGHVFLVQKDAEAGDFKVDSKKVSKLAWKPLPMLMSEVGNAETGKQYFPRTSNYYPKLFESLQSLMLPDMP